MFAQDILFSVHSFAAILQIELWQMFIYLFLLSLSPLSAKLSLFLFSILARIRLVLVISILPFPPPPPSYFPLTPCYHFPLVCPDYSQGIKLFREKNIRNLTVNWETDHPPFNHPSSSPDSLTLSLSLSISSRGRGWSWFTNLPRNGRM